MLPLVRSWCQTVRERGIIFGDHGENVLLEFGENLIPGRIIRRDLDLQVDPEIRAARNLPCDFPKSRLGVDIKLPKPRAYSLKYDAFLCHHLFDPLMESLRGFLFADEKHIRQTCKEEFHRCLPEADKLLPPDTTYYYGGNLLPDNEFELVDQKQHPLWR